MIWDLHPKNPQARLLDKVTRVLKGGGVVIYPTENVYAIGCLLGESKAIVRIRQIRELSDEHHFTLSCSNLAQISKYALLDNANFRHVKPCVPGPYTFILPATKEVPKQFLHIKKKTIGIRVPEHILTQTILHHLAQPLMSVSLQKETDPVLDSYEIVEKFEDLVDLIIVGECLGLPSSVVDLTGSVPVVIREGHGDVSAF